MPTLPEPKNLFGDDSGPKIPEPKNLLGGDEDEGEEDFDDRPAEETAKEELNELQKAFKARAQREEGRMEEVTDSEYWFAVCFQTRAQKEEFLKKLNLIDYGDKYLDGMMVAQALGVKLESPIPPIRKTSRNSGLSRLVD